MTPPHLLPLVDPMALRRCDSPPPREDEGASCIDALRESARRLGVLPPDGAGWFGRLVRARLRRSLVGRATPDWDGLYPGLVLDQRVERHVARAARRAALCGGISAAGAHVGETVTLLTEGLAAPFCVPAVVAAIAGEAAASVKVQIDLVFDLAAMHGVPFDPGDAGELAEIFDLALFAGRMASPGAGCCPDPRPVADDDLLARLGRGLFEDAVLGLVPFVGIPCTAASSYRATVRVGAVALRWIRRRVALRGALRRLTADPAPALLLEGAWLLATVDGMATRDELAIVAAIARSTPGGAEAALARLDAADEPRWLADAVLLDAGQRAVLLDALVITAGLRGPTRHPERCFLARVGATLSLPVDFARIDAIHRDLHEAAGSAPN
jgi:hypothetical protein